MIRIPSAVVLRCALVVGLIAAPRFAAGDEPVKADSAKSDPAKPAARSEPAKAKPKLTPRQQTFVKNELTPVAKAGDPIRLLALLSPQLPKLSPAHVQGMDDLLRERELPSIARLVTNARLELFRAKAESAAPELSLVEAVLIIDDTRQQIEELLAGAQKASFMTEPLPRPETLLGYRDLLFEVHVQKNELLNAAQLVEFGKTIGTALPASKSKTADDAQQEILGTSFRSFDGKIKSLERDMEERSLEMRVNRLDLALEVLSTASGLKEKFFAAYAIGIDGEFLLAGFKQGGVFQRPALQNDQLVAELERKVQRGKILAGDLLDKSRALFIGLHWWRRGRYGRGPEGGGLLKSAAATKSFEASVPLYMPGQSPVPTDPMKQGQQQVPDYDRRHHYLWAWEDRQFQLTGTGQQSSTSSQEIGRHSTGDFYFY